MSSKITDTVKRRIDAGIVNVSEPSAIQALVMQEVISASGALQARGVTSAKLSITLTQTVKE